MHFLHNISLITRKMSFAVSRHVTLDLDYQTFRVYECGTEGPVVLFLHGGGYSALSWAVLSVGYLYINSSFIIIL